MAVKKENYVVSENHPEWACALADYYGLHLHDSDVRRWWAELTDGPEGIRNLSYHEAATAIRKQAMRRERGKYESKPTLRDLRIWILSNRKFKGGEAETASEQFISRVKAKMLAEKDNDKKWEWLCAPDQFGFERSTTIEECRILESWAFHQCPGFHRPEWMKEAAKKLSEIMGQCAKRYETPEYETEEEVLRGLPF